jgi:hypothetical protein
VLRRLVTVALFVTPLLVVPRALPTPAGHAWFDGDLDQEDALARTLLATIDETAAAAAKTGSKTVYHTGRARFDGQSAIAFYQMALLGLGQVVLEHAA